MIVTKYGYPLERNLLRKFDLMIDRVNGKGAKKDVVVTFEGGEGEGKSTFSIASAIYFAEQTGRKFDHNHVFFDLEKMIDFAINNEEQIMVWDEPALQALGADWASTVVKNLTRLLMMARMKQHIIFINMTKFYKFNEYIVVDRSLALIHVYSRKNIQSGHFQYIKKKYLESLWRDYRFSKRRNYKKYASKTIRGTFPDVMNPKYKNNICAGFDIVAYERKKNAAIRMIGRDDTKEKKDKLNVLRKKIAEIDGISQTELAEKLGITRRTLYNWRDKDTPSTEKIESEPLNNTMGMEGGTSTTPPIDIEEKEENEND